MIDQCLRDIPIQTPLVLIVWLVFYVVEVNKMFMVGLTLNCYVIEWEL